MLDGKKLEKLRFTVVEPSDEDEKTATVYVVSKEAVVAMKAGLKTDGKS